MEEVTNTLSSVAFESEMNLELLESSSPASVLDDKDQINEETLKGINPTSKDFKKTWGFRKTTIAKRELFDSDMEATDYSQQSTPSLRRSGRQPKRTERVEEFLTAVRRNRGRKGLEEASDRSCPVTDAETASEGSVESPCDKIETRSRSGSSKRETQKQEDDSSDSDGMTLKEIQTRLRSRRSDNPVADAAQTQTLNAPLAEGAMRTRSSHRVAQLQQQTTPIKQEPQSSDDAEEQKPVRKVSIKRRPEAEIYDPNALYCICRQPHNNRFMICCDRCEEWFHGNCVGITERRGQLLEKDGEDYICPNCTILQEHDESTSESEQRGHFISTINQTSEISLVASAEQFSPDQGIKGRIEKAAHPSGKKKLKIFNPVEVPNFADMSADICETTEILHEVSTASETPESQDVASCIGPGCSNLALPDSVYCSHDCILKHAAATMKSLGAGKEANPKEKVKVKSERKSPPPKSQPAKPPATLKATASENPDTAPKRALLIPKMKTEESSDEAPAEEYGSSTPSWESDHNYIAVKPEKTAAISSTVLYKCMYYLGVLPLAHTYEYSHTIAGSFTLLYYKSTLISIT